MRNVFLWILRCFGLSFLLLFLLVGDRYMAMKLSLPELNGIKTVQGLTAPVTIERDENGIPHITGETQADVLFGLGYVHAQDRLWQMEVTRRIAAGRLSEILGPISLSTDTFFRNMDFAGHTQASYEKLSDSTRALLGSYTKGINAVLSDPDFRLPPEFQLLLYRPEAWRPVDSLAVIKMMSIGLSTNMSLEIERALLSQQLSPAQLADFFPPYPGDAPIILPQTAGLLYQPKVLRKLASALPSLPAMGVSNNWVIDGRHTASGKPLLANDPHLELTAPSIWYLAQLKWHGGDVTGATLAGFPAIVLGHNGRIAWGFTNTGADVQDLYVEKINAVNESEYLTPEGYAPFEVREETFKVRFGRDVTLKMRRTRHGPVLSDLSDRSKPIVPEGHVVALAWTALSDEDSTIEAGLDIMNAQNFSDFNAALRSYLVPMQNIVYGDVDGNIGFIAPARVPIRSPQNDLHGLVPAPGWLARYDWQGFIPFDQLPRRFNPASGEIVTANQKIVPGDYPYFITSQWQPAFRGGRITELLNRTRSHDISSFEDIQSDEVSAFARGILPYMLQTVPKSDEGRWALGLLKQWNGDMNADLKEPLVFVAWYRALTRQVYADELGPYFQQFWGFKPLFMKSVLTPGAAQNVWCDKVQTVEREACGEIMAQALEAALEDLKHRFGADPSDWHWGIAHTSLHRHTLFGSVPLLRNLFNISIETGGGFYTINRGGHWLSAPNPHENVHGSGYRAIYDLSDLDNSEFIQSTGQSGNAFSPYYKNFVKDWAHVAYVPMSAKTVDPGGQAHPRLILQPLTFN